MSHFLRFAALLRVFCLALLTAGLGPSLAAAQAAGIVQAQRGPQRTRLPCLTR